MSLFLDSILFIAMLKCSCINNTVFQLIWYNSVVLCLTQQQILKFWP